MGQVRGRADTASGSQWLEREAMRIALFRRWNFRGNLGHQALQVVLNVRYPVVRPDEGRHSDGGRRFELPVDKPGRCHAVAVATVGLAAAPARPCRFLLRVAFGRS